MSENITSGQEKPQNSPSVQQTSSQQPMMQPAPTAYATAASIPATRPKITALAMTAFIVSLACALLRLVEFGTMRSAMSSLQTVAAMNGGQSLRNYNTLESFVSFISLPLFLSIILYVLFGVFIYRGYNWSRIVMTVIAVLALAGIVLHTFITSAALSGMNEERSSLAPGFTSSLSTLIVIYVVLFIANVALIVFLWMPGTNRFMRDSKAYRLAQNPMAQPTVVQAQPVQPQAPHQN